MAFVISALIGIDGCTDEGADTCADGRARDRAPGITTVVIIAVVSSTGGVADNRTCSGTNECSCSCCGFTRREAESAQRGNGNNC